MNYLSAILTGFCVTFLTTLLPGLINMNVAKICLRDGKSRALAFASGAAVIVFFQAWIAVIFARFIDRRTDVSYLIQEIAIVIFLIISVYFFFFSKKNQIPHENLVVSRKSSRFFQGMFLSVLNVFPVPFYVVFSITMASYDYFSFEKYYVLWFSIGASSGAMMVFYFYTLFVKKIEHKTVFFMKNVNYLLGCVTLLIAILGIVKLLKD